MGTPDNLYAAPSAELRDPDADLGDEARATRQRLIRHEVLLKSLSLLFYLIGALALLALGLWASLGIAARRLDGWLLVAMAIFAAMAALYLTLGWGYQKLRPWVRIPGAVVAGLTLLSIPVGTLIGGYMLYLMFSRAGREVLAPRYQRVIAATPGVRYRRTAVDWIALFLPPLLVAGSAGLVYVLGSRID